MWKFRTLQESEPEQDPHEAEFFRLKHPSEAVVREFIQNSLDARSGSGPVTVRITLGKTTVQRASRFLGPDFITHLEAAKISSREIHTSGLVPFLTLEDHGTSGLDGDTGEGKRPEGRHNFYNFWWWEGKSAKRASDAGRWGLGKSTFHAASSVRAFWGFTIRIDDKRKLLLGKARLKAHRIGENTFDYRGYFVGDGRSPIDNPETIEQFRRAFSINRQDEPGLSLVIPYPESEIEIDSIINSVMVHYFYAIMSGRLKVDIRDPDHNVQLDNSSFIDEASVRDWSGTRWENYNVDFFLKFVEDCIKASGPIALSESCARNLEIVADSFNGQLSQLREDYASQTLIKLRVPVDIQELGKPRDRSYFDIYLRKDPTLKESREYYVRSEITIADFHTLGGRRLNALFVVQDRAISSFLGDAETPAHTKWIESTEGFKEKYANAVGTLRFIKQAMTSLVSLIDEPPKDRQIDFLKDIFAVPTDELAQEKVRITDKEVPPIPSRPRIFSIRPVDGGIRATAINLDHRLPVHGILKLGYDVRRGNPLKHYEPTDFDVGHSPLAIELAGGVISHAAGNTVIFEVTDPGFYLEITGFDPRRDLVVDVKERLDEKSS